MVRVFFGFEVGDRRPLLHSARPVDGATAQQYGFGQGRLAGATMSYERHVADLRWWVRLHASTSSSPAGRPGGLPLAGRSQACPVRLPNRMADVRRAGSAPSTAGTGAWSPSSEQGDGRLRPGTRAHHRSK